MIFKSLIHRIMGGNGDPPVHPLTEEDREREGDLTNLVQRAVSCHRIARKEIRAGNGRVIALLTQAVGGDPNAAG